MIYKYSSNITKTIHVEELQKTMNWYIYYSMPKLRVEWHLLAKIQNSGRKGYGSTTELSFSADS